MQLQLQCVCVCVCVRVRVRTCLHTDPIASVGYSNRENFEFADDCPRNLTPNVAKLFRRVIAMIGKLVDSTNTGNIRRKKEQNFTG